MSAARVFVARSPVPADARAVFDWHASPGAFERLAPPSGDVAIEARSGPGIAEGTRVEFRTRAGFLPMRWVAVHGPVEPGRSFEDLQVSGPFARWRHLHRFEPAGEGRSILEDRVEYALPMGAIGDFVGGPFARRALRRLFARRHAVTAGDLERHGRFASHARLTVAITGATGLVGSALSAFLTSGGHRVRRVVRSEGTGDDIPWDPARGRLDPRDLEGIDAVVHLAGESIAGGRWTPEKKRRIRESREAGTLLLAEALAKTERPPSVLVSASAVGWYGSRGEAPLDEHAERGEGFLPETCEAWEGAAEPARRRGIRVVHLRLGVVLAAAGGALAEMLPPFLLGAGGPIGSGRQGMSWVALDDVIGAFHFALLTDDLSGPFNVTAPSPLPQREFARTLGRVLGRPAFLPLPAFAVRAIFGEMGERLLLEGAYVLPRRLEAAGFRFRWPDLEGALRFELERTEAGPEFEEKRAGERA